MCKFATVQKYTLTLYDPAGAFKAKNPAPTPKFCRHAFNSGATLLCDCDFSKKIILQSREKKNFGQGLVVIIAQYKKDTAIAS